MQTIPPRIQLNYLNELVELAHYLIIVLSIQFSPQKSGKIINLTG